MSWLARSIANSLKLDDDEDDNHSPNSKTDASAPKSESDNVQDQFTAQNPRGVKEDLSELTKSFSRQLWGVASFLAPPPLEREVTIPDQKQPSDETDQLSDPEISDEALIEGIKSDFAEISGKFKSGITKLSSHAAVSEITKMASSFLQFGSELESTDALGVTEEVLLFVRTIATHPETWLEFPVPNNEEFDDFDMSDVQQEHALVVESLAPTLAALRMELCPGYMSEGCFWKIYFVLLHPRLTKHDAELLSTPQIVEARAMLACKLENRAKTMPESAHPGTATSYLNEAAELPREETLSAPSGAEPSESSSLKTLAAEAPVSNVAAELETDKHAVESTETKVVDKPVVKEEPLNAIKNQPSLSGSSAKASDEAIRNQPSLSGSSAKDSDEKFEDDGDDWLKEESEIVVSKSGSTMHLENDEDVSFSDLEEEDDDVPVTYKKATSGSDSSTKDSREWVQLSRSSADSAKDIKPVSSQSVGSQQVSARNPETKESSDWLDFDDIVEM